MATTSFPTVHRCLPPGDGRINSSLLCLVLPLSYSSNPSSLYSPQLFEFRDSLNHVANRRSLRSSKVRHSRSKSLVFPCDASIPRITEQEYTSQHCCCSPISGNQGPGISVFEKHACDSCVSRNRRTINFKENHLAFSWSTSNVSLYNAIIQGMCLRGKVDAAKWLYTKMREIDLVPDGKTHAMMLQHLMKHCR